MKNQKFNRIISIFLCLVIIFSCLPLNVFAIENEHIIEPGTYTFDENGNLVCSECGEIGAHSEDCSYYQEPDNKEVSTDSNAVKKCTCGEDIHSKDCPLYEESDTSCECDLINGVHDKECEFYVKPEVSCNCNSIYDIHDDTCPLYIVIEDEDASNNEPVCTCNTETDLHSEDCPLYNEPSIECECNLELGVHDSDCPLYKEDVIEDTCSCNAIDGNHVEGCPLYQIDEENSNICTCEFIDNKHSEDCPLFEETDIDDTSPVCTCGTESDVHNEDCALYVSPEITFGYLISIDSLSALYDILYNQYEVIATFTNQEKELLLTHVSELYNSIEEPTENDTQQYDYLFNIINSYIIVICESCGQEDGLHLDDCEFYVCDECGSKEHIEGCSKYVKIDIVCNECNEKNGAHLETCSLYIKPCAECGTQTNIHNKDCSLWVCDECKAHEHLETCSQFKVVCKECGEENNKHKETCSLYIDNRTLYEKMLDSDLGEIYEFLTNEENLEDLNNLSEEEIDEIIYYVGLIADDEDLEIEVLTLLYDLPNAPECPWKTLETDYIYFDLYYGNISITGTTYSGYDSSGQVVSGTHKAENQYYIYQSVGASTVWENGLPVYDRVSYNGESWGEYITDHPSKSTAGAKSVDEVIAAWGSVSHKASTVTSGAAFESGRAPTPNYVKIQGTGTFNVVIDDLWSSYQVKYSTNQQNASSFKNDLGGFVYVPEKTNNLLNLYLVGDNRFGNIHAATHDGTNGKYTVDINHTNTLTLQTLSGENDATLTLSNLWTDADTNSTASCIGGTDGHDHSVKMIFNSGIVYAGSGYKDFCTPIGGGGNGDGRVIINGGIITAVNSSTGAAIGGGCGTSGPGGYGEVIITDGEVYAYSYSVYYNSSSYYNNALATAIGGGSSGTQIGGLGIVNISGGYVYAYSEKGNAIGGGGGGYGLSKSGDTTYDSATGGVADVTISGGIIHAISGSGCAIGGGPGGGQSYDAYYTKNGTLPNDELNDGSTKVVANGGSANLEITGGTIYTGSIGGGSPQFHNNTDKNKYGFTIGAATVYISGGKTHGQVVMEGTGSRFEMEDGVIDNSFIGSEYMFVKDSGGAVYIKTGNAIVNGGTIKNSSSDNGGAIYVNGGNFEMNDGEIIDCTAPNGGAVNVDTGKFTMNGGFIGDNIADYGGAIYVNGGSFEVYGGEISNNEAIDGGAAYINGGDIIDIHNGIFDGNSASNNGGAIYAMSDASDIVINVFDGEITNNSAGNHGGAIGASASGSYAVILNIGEQGCLGTNTHLHDDGDCPMIINNISQEYGGAFCMHGNAEKLAVNIYCGGIIGNKAIKNYGSNSINQGGGSVTVWGGSIDPGIMVGGGIYTDNRIDSDQIIIRFWSNYEGGPTAYYPIECTIGVTVVFPTDTYVWAGHELSGWSTAADASGLYIPVQGEHTIEGNDDGYLDFYAVWDATTSYVVYIPETLDISNGYEGEMVISADINYFKKDSNLNIFLAGDFELINDSHPENVLAYELISSEFENQILSNNAIAATFQYNNVLDKIIRAMLLFENKRYSGDYSDVITFTVEYSEN